MLSPDQKLPPRIELYRKLIAFALYSVLSGWFFGRGLIGNFRAVHLGQSVDCSFLMWALEWWPYALAHHLNPFVCRLIWAPAGFNLAWSGGIPMASIAAAPLTELAGPLAAYNALALAAPIAAAWCGFLLCQYISGGYYAALAGGFIFGFSPYVLGQQAGGHLNLLLIFPIPLIVIVVIKAIRTEIHPFRFILLLAALFVIQFLCSIEIAASSAIFGAGACLAASLFADASGRNRLWALAGPLALAAIIALIVLSPYFYYLFQPGAPSGAINSPGGYSADLANLVIPTPTVQLGKFPIFASLARRFPGNLGERGAYLGLPLLIVTFCYGWKQRRQPPAPLLLTLLAAIVICALGPRIRIAGWTGFGMPWKLAMHLPLIKSALPGRFMNYAFLVAAIIASLWLADSAIRPLWRALAAALLSLSMLPNAGAQAWVAPPSLPGLFSSGRVRDYLRPDEIVVALPYGISGETMLWQAASGMAFRMAGGYTGITPREFERWPIVRALMTATYIPGIDAQLLAFMGAHGAATVIVDNAHLGFWQRALIPIDPAPRHAAGVYIYRAAAAILTRYREKTALEMEQRDTEARFEAELEAAHNYLAAHNDLSALTPLRAQQLHLLPADWVTDPDIRTNNGLYLGPWAGGKIAVGIVGSYDALQPLIAKYQGRAAKVLFPFPTELNRHPAGDTFMRLLVMVFDRATLFRAGSAQPTGTVQGAS